MAVVYECDLCTARMDKRGHKIQLFDVNHVCDNCVDTMRMTVELLRHIPFEDYVHRVYIAAKEKGNLTQENRDEQARRNRERVGRGETPSEGDTRS